MTDVDEFLAHYGVKGMKWGVIREDDPSSSGIKKTATDSNSSSKSSKSSKPPKQDTYEDLERRLRRRETAKKIAIGVGVAAALGVAVYGGKQVLDYNLEKRALDVATSIGYGRRISENYGKDSGELIKKGFEFIRSSTVPETEMKLRTFAVADRKDSLGYYAFGQYGMKLEAVRDLILPSTKERVDALTRSITDDEIRARAKAKASLGAKMAAMKVDRKKLAIKMLADVTDDMWLNEAQVERVVKALLDAGYSGVQDDMDGGSARILFDKAGIKYHTPTKNY